MRARHDIQPHTITELVYGVFPSFALLAGMKLKLFSHLSPGGQSEAGLAAALGTDPMRLRPLLDLLLAATGLVVRAGERLVNSPEAETFLVENRPDYRGNLAAF